MAETTQMKLSQILENGDASTTTINHINPNASNAVLSEFAHKLNELTTSTYNSATKVVTTDIDTAGDTRLDAGLAWKNSPAALHSGDELLFTIATDAIPYVYFIADSLPNTFEFPRLSISKDPTVGFYVYVGNANISSGTIVVHVDGNETYKPGEITIPFTAS